VGRAFGYLSWAIPGRRREAGDRDDHNDRDADEPHPIACGIGHHGIMFFAVGMLEVLCVDHEPVVAVAQTVISRGINRVID